MMKVYDYKAHVSSNRDAHGAMVNKTIFDSVYILAIIVLSVCIEFGSNALILRIIVHIRFMFTFRNITAMC